MDKLLQTSESSSNESPEDLISINKQSQLTLLKPKSDSNSSNDKIPGLWDLFKDRKLTIYAIVAGVIYLSSNYNYYGSVFGLEALKASIYFNSIFSALADFVGNLSISPVVKRFKRRSTFLVVMIVSLFLSAGFLMFQVPQACVDDQSDYCWEKLLQTALAAGIKIAMCISIGCMYLYISEIFPTISRGIGVGFVSLIGRFGSVFAPLIANFMIN